MDDRHEIIDSCLVLAPDPLAKKTQSRNNLTEEKDRRIEEKVMPLPEEPRDGISRDLRRPTLSKIWMKCMSFEGTVTMLLRVVAPETPETIDGF